MKLRITRLAAILVALFALLAMQEIRVQIAQRAAIISHPGNPRLALRLESRGTLLDAAGLPLAKSKAGRRIYPAGPALAQVIGYASPIYGESGLEAGLDGVVSPRRLTTDVFTALGELFGRAESGAPASGGDAVLTLRRDIAAVVDGALPQAIRGAAIVLDPRNGAILAAVNRPTFDPNQLAAQFKTLRARSDSPLLNRAFDGLYPPGSTFKMFTVSTAVDSGTETLEDVFFDPGYFQIGNFTIHNAEGEATGTQNLTGAFAHSSNVDFAQIGMRIGIDVYYTYLKRFHIGDDIGLSVEATNDIVPPKSTIIPSELAQMAFGQGGLAVTPLRMALIGAAIANGGLLMRPQLVKQFRFAGRPPLDVPATMWEPVISTTTANDVRTMMEAVVRYGTGTAAQLSRVAVAGKTGTATHPGGSPHAWFVCFAPAQAPRIVVAVVVENAGYGGKVAAPIAREILAGVLPIYAR